MNLVGNLPMSLDKRIAGLSGNAALAGLVTRHQDVPLVSPARTPTVIYMLNIRTISILLVS